MIVSKDYGFQPDDTTITTGNPVFIDVKKPPFRMYGLDEKFHRIPDEVAKSASDQVVQLAQTTPGGLLRFRSDSDYIVMRADLFGIESLPIISAYALSGFDVWFRENGKYVYKGCIYPSQGEGKNYIEGRLRFEPGMHDVIIYFPLFSRIGNVCMALREGSVLDYGDEFSNPIKPIVFYGSSIVHGFGASRPSMIYPSIISRYLDCQMINLGFSGAAKAEESIMRYIGGLDMSIFVYDYDYNAPNAEYLAQTHYRGYRLFREAQPDTPVIMASKVDYYSNPKMNEPRRKIVLESYNRGIAEGDKNLYFIDGSTIYDDEFRNELTYDNCHPNDAGYICMAKSFGKVIRKILLSLK